MSPPLVMIDKTQKNNSTLCLWVRNNKALPLAVVPLPLTTLTWCSCWYRIHKVLWGSSGEQTKIYIYISYWMKYMIIVLYSRIIIQMVLGGTNVSSQKGGFVKSPEKMSQSTSTGATCNKLDWCAEKEHTECGPEHSEMGQGVVLISKYIYYYMYVCNHNMSIYTHTRLSCVSLCRMNSITSL